MSLIHSIETSFPKNYYEQQELINHLSTYWKEKVFNLDRVKAIHKNVLVQGRHLALEPKEYFNLLDMEKKNKVFIEKALDLSTEAVGNLLEKAQIKPNEVSVLMSNTVTGFSIPSLEARLMNRIDFSPHTKRVPLLGLGCLAGVAGINRVMDYLEGHPSEAVVFFTVELCSLTLQLEDLSMANIISSGLFGDGAAAVLCVGKDHKLAQESKLKWIDGLSSFYPNTENTMGWDIKNTGLKIILGQDVPKICSEKLPKDLESILNSNELLKEDLNFFMAHPGGPKVLFAMEQALGLEEGSLKHSWNSLAQKGNMSSVSVLDIAKRTMESEKFDHEYGIMAALGPAFCSEIGLYQWVN
ncbi:MAG: type III polyketide synthase [Bacteriovoracaceae bacterium]